jgi:formylglycine-generating enzyme required for sulfatase activity
MMIRRLSFAIVFVVLGSSPSFSQEGTPKPDNSASFEGTEPGDRKELVPGIVFRWCPAGTFTMGSPRTELGFGNRRYDNEDQVQVTLSQGYWLGETEVTQGQWQKLMGTTPWKGEECVKEGEDYAASYISHDDADACCDKLTELAFNGQRLPKGWKFSLPTEAQWEYACRSGTTTKFSFGDNESLMRHNGWYVKNGTDADEEYAHQVGLKKANEWGLRDMHGNVWEWCSDWYGEKLAGGSDPVGAVSGSKRVCRGGGWLNFALSCRSADRRRNSPGFQSHYMGFRLAAVPN